SEADFAAGDRSVRLQWLTEGGKNRCTITSATERLFPIFILTARPGTPAAPSPAEPIHHGRHHRPRSRRETMVEAGRRRRGARRDRARGIARRYNNEKRAGGSMSETFSVAEKSLSSPAP